eukprot:4646377-Prymnesium_polylepis.9
MRAEAAPCVERASHGSGRGVGLPTRADRCVGLTFLPRSVRAETGRRCMVFTFGCRLYGSNPLLPAVKVTIMRLLTVTQSMLGQ